MLEKELKLPGGEAGGRECPSAPAPIIRYHRLRGLNSRDSYLTLLEAAKAKVTVLACGFGEGALWLPSL